jgi:SIR2-like domain
MDWEISWRAADSPYPAQNRKLDSTADVLRQVINLIRQNARDISITRVPAQAGDGQGIPYPGIVRGFTKKTIVPFLGAGVPLCERPGPWKYDPVFSDFLPSGRELADFIAHKCDLPAWKLQDTTNLARVASYYTITNPSAPLSEVLNAIFAKGIPNSVHKFLAEPILHPMVIVTTNYDTLMEKALEETGVDFDTVIHCTNIEQRGRVLLRKHSEPDKYLEPMELDVNPGERTVLYKMHGSIDSQSMPVAPAVSPQDNFLITEEDYVKFLSRLSAAAPVIPPKLLDHFRKTSFLFLGYSLEDWNVRVILDSLNDLMHEPGCPTDGLAFATTVPAVARPTQSNPLALSLKIPIPGSGANGHSSSRTHWAIQLEPTPYDIEVWRGRRVVVRNSQLEKFVEGLRSPIQGLIPR